MASSLSLGLSLWLFLGLVPWYVVRADVVCASKDDMACPGQPVLCIPRSGVCNNIAECENNEDETWCPGQGQEWTPKMGWPQPSEVDTCGPLEPEFRISSYAHPCFSTQLWNWCIEGSKHIKFEREKFHADTSYCMMVENLGLAINRLNDLVMQTWPSVTLRVIEAWDCHGEHGLNSLHYAGRAADVTTSDLDKEKYASLAALAVKAGLHWVHLEHEKTSASYHVHVSMSSDDTSATCKRSVVDKTIESGASGCNVVTAAVKLINEPVNFLPSVGVPRFHDNNILNRIAWVESRHGVDLSPDQGDQGGIWRVSEEKFNETVESAVLLSRRHRSQKLDRRRLEQFSWIQAAYGIDWRTVKYEDLNKPLYSALATHLILYAAPSEIPADVGEQADMWLTHVHVGSKSKSDFTEVVGTCAMCRSRAHVYVMLDSSGSVGQLNYEMAQNILKELTLALDLESMGSDVGMLFYGSAPNQHLDFTTDVTAVLSEVDAVPYLGGGKGKAIGSAIDFAISRFASVQAEDVKNGDRRNYVCIVLTDGLSRDDVLAPAGRAASAGIVVFSIGIGSNVNQQQLLDIANGIPQNVLRLSSHAAIDNIQAALQEMTCVVPVTVSPTSPITRTLDTAEVTFASVPVSAEGVTITILLANGAVDGYASYDHHNPTEAVYTHILSSAQSTFVPSLARRRQSVNEAAMIVDTLYIGFQSSKDNSSFAVYVADGNTMPSTTSTTTTTSTKSALVRLQEMMGSLCSLVDSVSDRIHIDRVLIRHLLPLVLALIAGLVVASTVRSYRQHGLMMALIGGQGVMNIYMKDVLSKVEVFPVGHLRGLPAPFAVTAMQQVVGFTVLVLGMASARLMGKPLSIRKFQTRAQVMSVGAMAVIFALNIGLNNLSLSLLDISVHLTIRSMGPPVNLVVEVAFVEVIAVWTGERSKLPNMSWQNILAMIVSFLGCISVVVSKYGFDQDADLHFAFGASICLLSVFASGMELVLVKCLTEHVKLNPLDTLLYMSLPAAALLVPATFLFPHPVPWPEQALTDVQVLTTVWKFEKSVLVWALCSGVLALGYNFLLYTISINCDAYVVSMAGNFGKLLLISFSILLSVEVMPGSYRAYVFWIGILANAAAFFYVQATRASKAPPK